MTGRAESTELREDRAQSGATRELAGFVAGLCQEHIPAEVIAKAKACILDAVGCILFGSTLPWTRMVADAARDEGGAPQTVLIGAADRAPVLQAVLVNATAGHGFELTNSAIGLTDSFP